VPPSKTELPASRDLDRLIEHCLGWRTLRECGGDWWEMEPNATPGVGVVRKLPHYSEKLEDAWTLVESVDNRNPTAKDLGVRTFTLNRYADGSYVASYFNAQAQAPTAPLAICRAALQVLERVG